MATQQIATTQKYDFDNIAKKVINTRNNKGSDGNPIPYNVFREWGMSENDHTKLLLSFLSYKNSNGQYRVLSSFLKRFTKGKGAMIHYTRPLVEEITFSRDFIDGLILIKDKQNNKYAVIIENKINDAQDQKDQIRRYIEHVKNETGDLNRIWVLYITSDGSKTIESKSYKPQGEDATTNIDNRFIPLTYSEDIINWLKEDVLGLRIYPEALTGVVRAYVDFLEDWFVNDGKEYDPYVIALCKQLHIPEIAKINQEDQIRRIYDFQSSLRKYLKESKSGDVVKLNSITRVAVRRLEKRAFRKFEETSISILNDNWKTKLKKKNLEWKVKHYRVFDNKGFIQLRLTDEMGTAHMEWMGISTSKMLCGNQGTVYTIKCHVECKKDFADDCRQIVNIKKPESFELGEEVHVSGKETSCVFSFLIQPGKPFARMTDAKMTKYLKKLYNEDLGFLFEMLIDKYDEYKDNYNQNKP